MSLTTSNDVADSIAETPPVKAAATEKPLPIGALIGWGLGSGGAIVLFAPYSNLFLRFMTDYLSIPAGLAGFMIGASRIVDASSDIVVGAMSDRMRSKWGRRRPFLFIGALLTSFCFVPLFAPPGGLSVTLTTAFLFAFVVLYSLGFAFWYVPYLAMTSEMTNSHAGRATLVSYRITGSSAGGLVGGAGATYLLVLFGGGRAGYGYMALTVGAVGLICMMACIYLSRKAPTTERHVGSPYTLAQQAKLMVQNRPFFVLMLTKILFYISLASTAVSTAFFIKHVYRLPDAWLANFILIFSLAMIASVPFWLWISKRMERRSMAILALSLNGLASLSYLFAHPGDPEIFALGRFLLSGMSGSGTAMMAFTMLADTMEYDYLKTGLRREGLFAGLVTLVEKSSNAIGIMIVGLLLSEMGYISSKAGAQAVQSPRAVFGIYLAFVVIPAILTFSAVGVMLFYNLTNAKLQKMRDEGAPVLAPAAG